MNRILVQISPGMKSAIYVCIAISITATIDRQIAICRTMVPEQGWEMPRQHLPWDSAIDHATGYEDYSGQNALISAIQQREFPFEIEVIKISHRWSRGILMRHTSSVLSASARPP